jgi:branched-chain amino acid transport system ATP-binding protein
MTDRLVIEGMRVDRAGRVVVHDVDITVEAGAVTALLGANGAGKSSLILGVAGVLQPLAGSVRLGSRELVGMPPHKIRAAGLAAVPEGHRILTDLSVADNLEAAGSMLDQAAAHDAIDDALGVFPELRERLDQLAGTLSGGQQQMLALGQALVCRPTFLIADELSLGLAPVVVSRLVEALQLIVSRGTGVLLIEQFTTVALELAAWAYLMERGRIVWSGDSAILQDNPDLLHQAYLAGDFHVADELT